MNEEIKASDLMIGNIVKVNNPEYYPGLKDIPFKVTEIKKSLDLDDKWSHYVGLEYINKENRFKPAYSMLMQFIEAIPLTEDILLKAGFEKERNYKGFLYKQPINGFRMRVMEDDINVFKDDGRFRYAFGTFHSIWLEYVHQLQNLFKILTDEDLKIQI